jgi:ribosomal protein S12
MFPSVNQLSKKIRRGKTRYLKAPAFEGAPFKRGIIYRIAQMSPRKPNSARRTFAKVRIASTISGFLQKSLVLEIIIYNLIMLF